MWFNSKRREERHQVLTSSLTALEIEVFLQQKVPGGAWLSSARVVNVGLRITTSTNLLLVAIVGLGTLAGCQYKPEGWG